MTTALRLSRRATVNPAIVSGRAGSPDATQKDARPGRSSSGQVAIQSGVRPPWPLLHLTTLACMVLTPLDSAAQYPYSLVATFGWGEVPEEHRTGSYAGSLALLWRVSASAELGVEAGYQRFGSHPQSDIIGFCPFFPEGACEGQITSERTSSGNLWFVGPTLRLGLKKRGAAFRPLVLWGLGRYASEEQTRANFRDDRGVPVPLPGSGTFERTFLGIGTSGGLGFEGRGLGRFQWAILARVHGAIGGMSGELADVFAYTVTAGLTLVLGEDRKVETKNGTPSDQR